MTRWSEADLARVQANLQRPPNTPRAPVPAAKPPKYRNVHVQHQGERFHSKREMEAWKAFKLQALAGGIRAVIRQVSLPMPESTRRIRLDFLVIENDGTHRWYDSKGFETSEFRLKADIIKSAYGITVELI